MERIRQDYNLNGQRQRGVTLLVSLILLVAITVVGINMFSSTTLEERLARNYNDYNVAFHAAEAAIRDAEIRISGQWELANNAAAPPSPLAISLFNDVCDNGLCTSEATSSTAQIWEDASYKLISNGTGKASALGTCDECTGGTTGSPAMADVYWQPRYLIEYMGASTTPGISLSDPGNLAVHLFRITAAGFGQYEVNSQPSSVVVLQSVYAHRGNS